MVFNNRIDGYIEVHNENLLIVSLGKDAKWHLVTSLSLSAIFDKDNSVISFPEKLNNYNFSLLIIPDFWFGNARYPFRSHNKSVIRSFLGRKLSSEFPNTPRIKDFFSFNINKNENGEQEIVTRFPQEPRFYDLYRVLTENDLKPLRISSPALIWNRRLKNGIEDFNKIGLGLIHLSESGCSLFFFVMGDLLFSRTIYLPESEKDQEAQLQVITYEMNQSIYHYSQRKKKDLDKIYLFSEKEMDVRELSESLGREVLALPPKVTRRDITTDQELEGCGDAANFEPSEILEPLNLPGVSDQNAMNKIAVNKIYWLGLAAGLVLLAVFGIEFFILAHVRDSESRLLSAAGTGPTQLIQQYNEALDILLAEEGRKDPLDLMKLLAMSLPEDFRVESAEVSTEKSSNISLSGLIEAKRSQDLTVSLKGLVEQVNKNIPSSKPLTIDDMDIEIREGGSADDSRNYHISFKLDAA